MEENQKNVSIYIDNKEIEIVKEYNYLGSTVTDPSSFSLAQKTLFDKAINAFFKIRKNINLSKLKLDHALKIFGCSRRTNPVCLMTSNDNGQNWTNMKSYYQFIIIITISEN